MAIRTFPRTFGLQKSLFKGTFIGNGKYRCAWERLALKMLQIYFFCYLNGIGFIN